MRRASFWLPIFTALFLSLGGLLIGATAQASSTYFSPVSLGIVPPLQFPPTDFAVTGARLSIIYGQQRNMYGLDIGGIGNVTQQTFVGTAVSGIFNSTYGPTTVVGLQLAGLFNSNTNNTSIVGLQIAGAVNSNSANSTMAGVQAALLANVGKFTTVYGAEIGIYNKALTVNGLQIGLVNVATNLRGIQIGLLNFYENGLFHVSPLINVGL